MVLSPAAQGGLRARLPPSILPRAPYVRLSHLSFQAPSPHLTAPRAPPAVPVPTLSSSEELRELLTGPSCWGRSPLQELPRGRPHPWLPTAAKGQPCEVLASLPPALSPVQGHWPAGPQPGQAPLGIPGDPFTSLGLGFPTVKRYVYVYPGWNISF